MRLSSIGLALRNRGADPVLSAGGVYLANAATGLLLPGFTYTRSGPDLWCPQADGSLASFAANVIPREYAGGRWGFRFDPGWTQHALWTDEITAARGWNLAFITPDVNVGGISPPHPGGSYTRLTVNSAGLALIYRTATVTPGASETLSFMVRLGTLSASDLKFGIYNETAASWIAVDQVPAVTPTASGWTRCDVSVTIPAGCTSIRLYPFRNNLAAAGATFYLAMVNGTTTSYPVPLTVAQGTAGTVGNHSCSALLSALGVTLGAEYTIGMDYEVLARIASQFPPVAQLRVGATGGSNITTGFFVHPNGSQYGIVRDTSDIYIQQSGGSGFVKSALRVKNSDFRASSSGVLAPVGSTGTQPSGLTAIQVARDGTGAAGALRLSKLWIAPSRALTDTELQAVTA